MRLLSYRGPCAPGGVSSALTQVFELQACDNAEWWYVHDEEIHRKNREELPVSYPLDQSICRRHYRYCNNFLWPVLHDLPHLAHYSEEERQGYLAFNSAVAFRLKSAQSINREGCFVNDYQFSFIPKLLKSSADSFVFWHIPWPKQIMPQHLQAMTEVALGILHARLVGFHTIEYLENFFQFVQANLSQFEVQTKKRTIRGAEKDTTAAHTTKFLVAPLGLDSEWWADQAKLGSINREISFSRGIPCILSVDRADYTKGLRERFEAIDCFFAQYPEWRQKVTFLQLGMRSRKGLAEFDRYWQDCQQLYARVNARQRVDDWQPLNWSDTPRSAVELASLYRRASVMLVSPVRDGLNLTAKEYIACQQGQPGVLALSPGAGVWSELGRDCVHIEPQNSVEFAGSIAQCLRMSESESLRRARALRERVASNSLASWWQTLQQAFKAIQSQDPLAKACG